MSKTDRMVLPLPLVFLAQRTFPNALSVVGSNHFSLTGEVDESPASTVAIQGFGHKGTMITKEGDEGVFVA